MSDSRPEGDRPSVPANALALVLLAGLVLAGCENAGDGAESAVNDGIGISVPTNIGCLPGATCDDGNPCTDGSCVSGKCHQTTKIAATACDDGNPCTISTFCLGDTCGYGKAAPDRTTCVDRTADLSQGCPTSSCEAGICKTFGYTSIITSQPDGPFGVLETSCRRATGCDPATLTTFLSEPLPDGTACRPKGACDAGSCQAGVCVLETVGCCTDPWLEGRSCDDDDLCTTAGTCKNNTCEGQVRTECPPGGECETNDCNRNTGQCTLALVPDGTACDDGSSCTTDDACSGGACNGNLVSCADADPCTLDACTPSGCVHTLIDADADLICDTIDNCPGVQNPQQEDTDGDKVGDLCDPCPTPQVCDDQNPCTDDSCDPVLGCVNADLAIACDDGDACTTDDLCSQGACAGTAVPLDDGLACTIDTCQPDGEVTHVPQTAGTSCRPSSGACNPEDFCDGVNPDCPADLVDGTLTECRASLGPCDVAEFCDGVGAACPADDVVPSGDVCRSSEGVCDPEEACDGQSPECPADVLNVGDVCQPSAGACDPAETCDGQSPDCPSDDLAPANTECRASAGACDPEDFCDGVNPDCPTNLVDGTLTECRASLGPCDVAEFCDGVGAACPADDVVPSGDVCRSSAGACDPAETCDGQTPECPADVLSTGTVCQPSAGACDPAESCDGQSPDCPSDDLAPANTECRASAGACDPVDFCDGVNPDCPTNLVDGTLTECRASLGACDPSEYCDGVGPECPADSVLPSGEVCRSSGGVCDPEEACDGQSPECPSDVLSAGVVCQASIGDCDPAEWCDGQNPECPSDAKTPSGVECRTAGGPCDMAEFCDGTSDLCPDDVVASTAFECRVSEGACDPAETCDGQNAACPVDVLLTAGDVCRSSEGTCDPAETCDGQSPECPADVLSAGTVCQPSAGACDPAETCDGQSPDCPSDDLAPANTECRASVGACDPADFCDGVSPDCPTNLVDGTLTECRASLGACDIAEFCDGQNPACPMDLPAAVGTTCPEGQCDANGDCKSTCIPCGEKNCGSDGCGGSCGTCGPGAVCESGTCVPTCDCGTRVCGMGPCGQSCGQCANGSACTPAGQCQPTGCSHSPCDVGAPLVSGCSACVTSVCTFFPTCCGLAWDETCVALASVFCTSPTCCVPDCSGRTCGSDGCGGQCGSCTAPDICDASGQCATPAPCEHDVCSMGAPLVSGCDPCVTSVCALDDLCCNDGWDSICVDEANEICGADCCIPKCSGKDCGDDGCGGTCGDCAGGLECAAGVCDCPLECTTAACGTPGCIGECAVCAPGTHCDGSGACTPTVTGLASGEAHTCVLTASGQAACFGLYFGAITPPAPASGQYVQVCTGTNFVCALDSAGELGCWNNFQGTIAADLIPDGPFTRVGCGDQTACAVRTDGTVTCFNADVEGTFNAPAGPVGFVELSGGTDFMCGLGPTGSLRCWGNNGAGVGAPAPSELFVSMDAGRRGVCAIRQGNKTPRCWEWGQTAGATAVVNGYAPNVALRSVSVGGQLNDTYTRELACGIRESDDRVTCWYRDGDMTFPVALTQIPDRPFRTISVGGSHVCGLDPFGALQCWGTSIFGATNPCGASPLPGCPRAVPVANASFEEPATGPGTFIVSSPPTGWARFGAINDGARSVGVLNPATTTLYAEPPPHGQNVGVVFLMDHPSNPAVFLGQASGLQQNLGENLAARTSYTVLVEVGNIAIGGAPHNFAFGGFPGYRLDLVAGSTVVGTIANPVVPPEGRFDTAVLVVSIGEGHPQIGQPLSLRLVNLNAAPGIEVNFDDVRVEARRLP